MLLFLSTLPSSSAICPSLHDLGVLAAWGWKATHLVTIPVYIPVQLYHLLDSATVSPQWWTDTYYSWCSCLHSGNIWNIFFHLDLTDPATMDLTDPATMEWSSVLVKLPYLYLVLRNLPHLIMPLSLFNVTESINTFDWLWDIFSHSFRNW